ncbi:Aspartyl-tRNA synthetase, archaeal-type, partial [Trema orientale]
AQVRVQTIRPVNKNIAFVVVRERGFTVQCVVTAIPNVVSRQMVKFVSGLCRESIIDVQGIVSVTKDPITDATQQVCPSASSGPAYECAGPLDSTRIATSMWSFR